MKRILNALKVNILFGFFLIIPVVVTLLIFNFFFKTATNWMPPGLIEKMGLPDYTDRIVALLLLFIFLYIAGLLIRNIFGRRLYQLGDKILTSIPFIKSVYIPVRQITESLFTQRNSLFKEVVMLEYPRKGLWSIAFITAVVPSKMTKAMGETSKECVTLFIPTTPNPTSGILILVPKKDVTPLTIPVQDALTYVMSAGAVAPGDSTDSTRPTLLDKLEEWLTHGDSTPAEPANADETAD